MAWYHYIATYMIMGGFFLFWVIPDKPWQLWLVCIGLVIVGLLMGVFLPHKEDKYVERTRRL